MVVILISFFSGVIIFITVYSIIKALNVALNRDEISKRKYRLILAISIFIGAFVAVVLPLGYQRLFDTIL
ncbi:hypothetical protein [Guptibacillus hwajinpoensis]|uniref:hypothetical protein n=1 Tax=Guptibacillus hwajinpoensis TaxID=208199 RepID=UPI001CFCEA86|nr:hypothetical protein [Pseudalkalibacillus hwajinpoensis]WLR60201.1 hypothetical protein LC071_02085 [Pseudalkalibacillus hwajinpoensis]